MENLSAVPDAAGAVVRHERGRAHVTSYYPQEYGGHSQVFQTVRDEDGILYATNYGKVLVYDGVRWDTIAIPGASFLYGIAALSDGRLAICGIGIFGLLEPGDSGQWIFRSLLDELPEAERAEAGEIWDLYATPEGLFCFTRRMMLRWNGKELRVWTFDTEKMIYGFWSGSAIYVQVLDAGLYRLEGESVRMVSDEGFWQRPGPRLILEEPDGGLLVATMKEGLWHWRNGGLERFPTGADAHFGAAVFNRGLRLRDGRIALGTFHGGVVILSRDGRFDQLLNMDAGLPSNSITHLYEDATGGLWCSLNSGLARVDLSGSITYFDHQSGLPAVSATQILRHANSVYMATNEGLFELEGVAPPETPRWRKVPEVTGEMYDLRSHDGELFAAVQGRVMRLYGGTWEAVWDGFGLIRKLVPSPSDPDRIYVAGRFGLGILYRQGGRWQASETIAALQEDYGQSIAEDANGNVWLGTVFSGLIRIRSTGTGADWIKEATVLRFDESRGLPVREHLALRFEDGRLLVDSPQGNYRINEDGTAFLPREADGEEAPLPGWAWDVMISDRNATRWGSIYPLEGASDDFNLYVGKWTPAAGGTDAQWNWIPPGLFEPIGGILRMFLEDGDEPVLWVGGWRGLLRWELDKAPMGSVAVVPQVRFRKIAHEEHGLLFGGAGAPEPWHQGHSSRGLRFQFAAPVMVQGQNLEYRSRLQGYEPEWTGWSTQTEREFTNLPGGDYRMQIEARSELATSSAPATIGFVIQPPWYFGMPAFTAYFATLGLLFWGGVRWRSAAERRENQRLERLVEQRTSELQTSESLLREARDAATSANRAKSRFLANMSHELRTPLNAIMGYAQILDRDATLQPHNRERARILQNSSKHLLHLINEVLDLSKIEAGRTDIRPAPTRLSDLAASLIASFQPAATAKGIKLDGKTAPGTPELVELDAQRVEQVLVNLIGNAIKFTDSGQVRLAISAARPAGTLHFSVEDSGCGIPAEQHESIFEPFQQLVNRSGDRAHAGTGLGLAISRSLAEAMGGQLSCSSTPQAGSCFTLELPLKELKPASTPETSTRQITGYEGPQRTILVVDDLEVNRSLVRDMLEPLGFAVKGAADGPGALNSVQTTPPDLILLDMRMAPMDGSETITRLRAIPSAKAIPVISYSASLMDFSREDAIALGCNDAIAKPFLIEDLLERIGQLLTLTWQYAATSESQPTNHPLFRFSNHDLQHLRALAHRRQPAAIKLHLQGILDENPHAADVVEPLLAMVKTFQLAQLSQQLDQQIPADSS